MVAVRMATNIPVSNKFNIGHKYGLPIYKEGDDVDHWSHEIDLWELVTDLPAEKRAPIIYLSLEGKARQACAVLTKEHLNAENGVQILKDKLRALYALDKEQATYVAYEKFECHQRKSETSIIEYINEFDRLYNKLTTYQIVLPSCVFAFRR